MRRPRTWRCQHGLVLQGRLGRHMLECSVGSQQWPRLQPMFHSKGRVRVEEVRQISEVVEGKAFVEVGQVSQRQEGQEGQVSQRQEGQEGQEGEDDHRITGGDDQWWGGDDQWWGVDDQWWGVDDHRITGGDDQWWGVDDQCDDALWWVLDDHRITGGDDQWWGVDDQWWGVDDDLVLVVGSGRPPHHRRGRSPNARRQSRITAHLIGGAICTHTNEFITIYYV